MVQRVLVTLTVLLLSSFTLVAQSIPTATITGRVMAGEMPLPGVTISVSSPNLQGTRTTVSSEAGDYILPLLPPGEYTVRFELAGMETISRRLTLTAARTDRLDIDLQPETLAETINVTSEAPVTAPLEATQVSTNFKQEVIEKLPVARNLEAVTLLAPGVAPTGPSENLVISGAASYDSLFLVNGAIVNENLRGQPHNLFIEDAIQETTVATGAISAEYGHFTGGVINAITKSGGNDFRGSLRTNFTNESWTEKTPLTVEQADDISEVYEGTLGGPVLRDRLWFFGAGRFFESEDLRQTRPTARAGDINPTPIVYPHGTEETRLEGKLTGSITPRHNVVFSYVDIEDVETNGAFTTNILDLRSLEAEEETPNTLLALNYSGTLRDNLFIEAQYSEKEYAFLGGGSPYYDLIGGTLIIDRSRGSARYNAPTFKNQPGGEQRNHEQLALKGSYFLSSPSLGSHDIKLGYEDFSEVRDVNNFQSGSDYRVSASTVIIRGDQVFPVFRGGPTGTLTRITWNPIFVLSDGSDYQTRSVFLNDRWSLNDHWTFNLGVRYDENDAIGGAGLQIGDDSAFSPRLAAHYDLRGDGRLIANVSYGQYVGRLSEGIGNDADPAGRSATLEWNYRGPDINPDVNAPTSSLIPTDQALDMLFRWFFANGGTSLRPFRNVSVPGVSSRLDPNGLKSPNVKEWTLGFGGSLGTRGYARADFIYRDWDDFYAAVTDTSTGQVTDQFGTRYDLTVITNSDIMTREYTGVQTQFNYRFLERLTLGGTYTWSRLVGNFAGENAGSGPIVADGESYPEYGAASWNFPTGYLTGDRRHRARVWASYDIPMAIGELNFTLLQSFDSGTLTSTDGVVDPSPYVTNPGYLDPPEAVTYYFGGRGNLKSDDITSTDLALNFATTLFGLEVFFQPEVLNIFNEEGVEAFDEEILTAENVTYLAPFNPYTERPIECPQGASAATCQSMGAHWQKGQNFGEPTSEASYQAPRTFRFSVGVRF
jgi:hypothetical protein